MESSVSERRRRSQSPAGTLDRKHRRGRSTEDFSRAFSILVDLSVTGVNVSTRVEAVNTGTVLLSIDDHVSMPTASIGQVILLIEVAARLEAADAFPRMTPTSAASGTPGYWQHLDPVGLTVPDLAMLVAATNDAQATNTLLDTVGLAAVSDRALSLGLSRTALLDLVRRYRGPDDAPHSSIGSAKELSGLCARIARGEVVNRAVSRQVALWLRLHADLSLVAGAFGLSPLDHTRADHGLRLWHATGSSPGVRSEIGVLSGPRAEVAYAVTVAFLETTLTDRLRVLQALRDVGMNILEYVH